MNYYEAIGEKIQRDRTTLAAFLKENRANSKVVFTNGCFDLLHPGHVTYLSRARDLGDLLVVGLNSDDSVAKLKGPGRPLNKERDRAIVLAGLACVDYVVGFAEATPIETLRVIRPAIHCKGGDYKPEDLPEKDVVEQGGGRIVILDFVEGYSTTSLVNKMK